MMEKIKKDYRQILKLFLFCLPLCLGIYGYFVLAGIRFPDAIFRAISLYAMSDLDTPPNICVEIARWTAPLATASGFIWFFAVLHERFGNWIRYMKGNSIAVYGDGQDADSILNELGNNGIHGKTAYVKASRYILLGNEEENLSFYRQNRERLREKRVYMKCGSLHLQLEEPNLKFFCEEETAARLYWRQSGLYGQAKNSDFRLKIAIVGFGRLEQELLLWGLQDNIFSADQSLEYHIWGGGSRFQAIYHELEQIQDPVIFHSGSWYEDLAMLQEADRILIRDKEELKELLFALPGKDIDVLAENEDLVRLLEGQDRLRIFFWKKEAQKVDNILEDRLLENAKRLNLRYAHIYSHVEENEENKEGEWNKLDSFTRYSNISAADYHEIRCQMINEWRAGQENCELSPAYEEMLSELEHIRWCRYHYLNNWKYGIPENGKSKDKNNRIHKDLVPYEMLSEEDKEKDRENVRILMKLL